MDLRGRIKSYIDSLAKYPPKEHPAGQVADIFNALLEQVKQDHPEDPIVAAIGRAGKTTTGKSAIDAGSLIAAAQQLLGALPEPPARSLVA